MKKSELISILASRIKALRAKHDVTKGDEYNIYLSGYIKGLQEAGAMIKGLDEEKQ